MDAVVLGGGGFIGGHLVARLLEDGMTVRSVDKKPLSDWYQAHDGAENVLLDVSTFENAATAVRNCNAVFLLACDMGGMGFLANNRVACLHSVDITSNSLRAAYEAGSNRVFYASSACIYPDFKQQVVDVALKESDAWPADPEPAYGLEKLYGEEFCHWYQEEFKFQTRVGRYHNVYGSYGTWDGGREKAPAAICRKVAIAKLTKEYEIEIWGDGEQTRSFMHVDDCIDGTLRLFYSNIPYPLNVGSDRFVTINELVSIIEGIAGVELERSYDLSAPQGVRGRNSDNTLVKKVLGWEPKISLEDGLVRTYEWVEWQVRNKLGY